MNDQKQTDMKPRIKTILFLLLTVYIIPGIFLVLLDREMLLYYLLIISSTVIPYYSRAAAKKRSCKFLGIEFKF
jgi:hypothetical protein